MTLFSQQGDIPSESYVAKLARTCLLAMDVDGVLTDGSLAYDSEGREWKQFHVTDGLGLVLLAQIGVSVAWITGRSSSIVERRAQELRIPYLMQGVRDKSKALDTVRQQMGIAWEEIAYIGDDWNDLPVFQAAGVKIAVSNAVTEVKALADMVTLREGGKGAVREVCDALLDARGVRASCLADYLENLRSARTEEKPIQ